MLDKGFEILNDFISSQELNSILSEIEFLELPMLSGGLRNAEKKIVSINRYASSKSVRELASQYVSGTPKLVRAILFNKTQEKNWLVSWHQDKTVCVSKRFEQEGWGPWSIKDNVLHVQPPLDVLRKMVTFRVHLDGSTIENGCLRVLPNSHSLGVISQEAIYEYARTHTPVECIANKGSALVMRPHILHSSSKGLNPNQRRVLHLEFSSFQLPAGAKWA